MKLVSTFTLTPEQVRTLTTLGVEVTQLVATELETARVDQYEIVVGQMDKSVDFSRFTNLKLWQLTSMGYDRMPLSELTQRRILVYHNRNAYTIPVAEMVITYILMLQKSMIQFHKQQQLHQYKSILSLQELATQRVLVVGTGQIGTEIARKLQVFDCEVIGANRLGLMKHYFDRCIRMDEVDEFLDKIDILILALPANTQTEQRLNIERLSLLKQEAIIINIGRGSLIDEAALVAMLEHGKLAGAALDVFVEEPLPDHSPLWDLPNVLVTPHNAFASVANQERTFNNIFETVAAYIKNKPLTAINQIK
ncbi:MAG: NAD(P)-dependent oxidoreductase [Culicoidibacterales bacterium]